MIWLVDIGNTNTSWCAFTPGAGLGPVKTAPTAQFRPETLDGPIAACCVVPECRERLLARGAFLVSPEHPGGVRLEQMDVSTLGADRIANAAALLRDYPRPALVVDFGTAITIESVDSAGRFAGGAILPGRALLRKSLTHNTAQLPEATWKPFAPDAPGFDTDSAIRLGVDLGAVGAVREVLDVMKKASGARSVVAAGGDRAFFRRFFGEMLDGGDCFTLRGVLYCWEKR
ncbi:MAG: type III pantothenate kinase [Victivallaceae bacterium]|nr:type III pantothenate kinase [Victivallaceae bacterium]